MNIAIEYLTRNGLLRELLTIPCSLFLKNKDGQKLVVTIHEDEQEYLVSQYKIYECLFDSRFPPIDRYFSSDLFNDPHVLVSGFEPIECLPRSISVDENGYNSPMPTEIYNSYFENILNVEGHRRKKEQWLWSAFVDIFHPQMPTFSFMMSRLYSFPYRFGDSSDMEEQQANIRNNFPHDYKNWLTWKTMMLDFDGVPAELVFRRNAITSLPSSSFSQDGGASAAIHPN